MALASQKEWLESQEGYNLRSRRVLPVDWLEFVLEKARDQRHINALKKVPRDKRTAELCHAAVMANTANMASVPLCHLTPELCLYIARHGCLRDIPESHRTAGVCLEAMNKSAHNIRWIPGPFLSEELCLMALSHKTPHRSCYLHNIPVDLRTPAACHLAVTKRGIDLFDVPESLKTPELCHMAAIRDDYTHCPLSVIPESMRTREICDAAYARNKKCYTEIPEDLKQFYADEVHPDMPPLDTTHDVCEESLSSPCEMEA